MRNLSKALLAGAAMMTAGAAHAQLSQGTLGFNYLYPDAGSVYYSSSFSTSTPETGFNYYFTTSATDHTITTDHFAFASYWNFASFNGFEVYDLNGTIDPFTSVTIDPISNMAGLDASRISFDADHIWVNWNGLSFDPSTVVRLDVNGGAVPEPASWAMMLGGFGLVGGVLRSRRKASVSFA
jgi:hypothetical protein